MTDHDESPDHVASPVTVRASNSIVYTDQWSAAVRFYRVGIGLGVTMERDWFVEFELCDGARLSVADSRRATIAPGDGSGLTLSWRVDDASAARSAVIARGLDPSPLGIRWAAHYFFVFDPGGNRIEMWSPVEGGLGVLPAA